MFHQWGSDVMPGDMTCDEALAQAISESGPGDIVIVHADDCDLRYIDSPTDEDLDNCDCEPTELVVGAQA